MRIWLNLWNTLNLWGFLIDSGFNTLPVKAECVMQKPLEARRIRIDGIDFGPNPYPRFVEQFNLAFLRLPSEVRLDLIRYWSLLMILIVELPKDRMAECSGLGCVLTFDENVIEMLPDEELQTLVAHEILHSYDIATNPNFANLSPQQHEDFVFYALNWWGFDASCIDAFVQKNYPEFLKVRASIADSK